MAAKSGSFQQQKRMSSLLVNGVLTLICLVWIIPAAGILIPSFRQPQDIFGTGWWTVFPHRGYVQSGEIKVDPSIDLNGPIPVEGITASYDELRNGVLLPDGTTLAWY